MGRNSHCYSDLCKVALVFISLLVVYQGSLCEGRSIKLSKRSDTSEYEVDVEGTIISNTGFYPTEPATAWEKDSKKKYEATSDGSSVVVGIKLSYYFDNDFAGCLGESRAKYATPFITIIKLLWSNGTSSSIVDNMSKNNPKYVCDTTISHSWDDTTKFDYITFYQADVKHIKSKSGSSSGYMIYGFLLEGTDSSGNSVSYDFNPKNDIKGFNTLPSLTNSNENPQQVSLHGSPIMGFQVELGNDKYMGAAKSYFDPDKDCTANPPVQCCYYLQYLGVAMHRMKVFYQAPLASIDMASVSFDMDKMEQSVSTIKSVSSGLIKNCASDAGTASATSGSEYTNTYTSTYTSAFSISNSESITNGVSITASAGLQIAEVATVDTSVQASWSETTSSSHSYTYQDSSSTSSSTTSSMSVTYYIEAGTQAQIEFSIYSFDAQVPYSGKITLSYADGTKITQNVVSLYTVTEQYGFVASMSSCNQCTMSSVGDSCLS
eukprot:Nk52_evm6s172 gene=Nk52_evmTU6s172